MRGEAGLDALADAKFLVRLVQPDRAPVDRVDRGQRFLARVNIGVINPVSALQAAVWPDDRRNNRGVATARR